MWKMLSFSDCVSCFAFQVDHAQMASDLWPNIETACSKAEKNRCKSSYKCLFLCLHMFRCTKTSETSWKSWLLDSRQGKAVCDFLPCFHKHRRECWAHKSNKAEAHVCSVRKGINNTLKQNPPWARWHYKCTITLKNARSKKIKTKQRLGWCLSQFQTWSLGGSIATENSDYVSWNKKMSFLSFEYFWSGSSQFLKKFFPTSPDVCKAWGSWLMCFKKQQILKKIKTRGKTNIY